MWTKATKFGKLPSEIIDPDNEYTPLTRYQVDNAVTFFGITMENAIAETKEVKSGRHTETVPAHDPDQLFEDDFKLPRPPTKLQKRQEGATNLVGLASDPRSGVKMWREKKLGEE